LNRGFDIYSRIRNGKTVEALPYAVSTAGGVATLYDVDLLTGAVESDGAIGDPTVTDIAIPLNQLQRPPPAVGPASLAPEAGSSRTYRNRRTGRRCCGSTGSG